MKFAIRTLNVADEGLVKELFAKEGVTLNFTGLGARNTNYFGAFSTESELVAVVAMTWSRGFEGVEIFNVLTKKAHRRRGYVKALMMYAHRVAIELGHTEAQAQVDVTNHNAIRLLEGLGYHFFSEYGIGKRSYGMGKVFGAVYKHAA